MRPRKRSSKGALHNCGVLVKRARSFRETCKEFPGISRPNKALKAFNSSVAIELICNE